MLAEGARPIYASGECEIDLALRELRVGGSSVPLGGRAFEIIELLTEAAGALVSKNELMDRIWPGVIVNENALQVHVSALRKALGAHRGMLKTESGRGYRLVGDWTIRHQPPPGSSVIPFPQSRAAVAAASLQETKEAPTSNLPVLVTNLVGRSAALPLIRELLSAYRVVTLTGPAGIGKTSLAIEVARSVLGDFDDGGWLVELAPLADGGLVPTAAAGVLGLKLMGSSVTAEAVARAIGNANLLLILDNCEHVIDAAAELAEAVVRFCPRASVLATTREVLRIDGEHVHRVRPLDVPEAEQEDPEEILRSGAVELLIARTEAFDSDFSPAPGDVAAVAAICRQLDGIPLAIEFAAARVAVLGLRQVAAALGDRFRLLTSGRRTAVQRHQTLRAALDWSYELLLPNEQRLLRQLAIFPGGLTFDAAASVVAPEARPDVVVDGISSLVAKSLVVPDEGSSIARWRLLETTRAYALEKLRESGEVAETERRHAEYCLTLFAPFSSQERLQAGIDDLRSYRREVDNLRAALNWAFSPGGDTTLGVALAAAATDFWTAVSQIAEASEWCGKALAEIGDDAGSRHEMVLQCSLGMALIYTRGMIASARERLLRALALARALADFDYQQRALHGLWLFSARSMAVGDALAYARQYEEVSRDRDPHSQATADWLIGHTQLYLAEHREASTRLQRAIDRYPIESRDRDMIRFVNDLHASAFGHLSASLLSLGRLDAAARVAANAVEEARATNQPIALCIALAWEAGLVFLSLGDLAAAERYGEELIDRAYRHALRPFYAAGLCVRGSIAAKRGDPESGLDPLRRGLAEMQEARYLLFYPFFKAELAAALGASGRIDDGLAEIDGAIRFAEETDYRWFVPELFRVKGDVLLQRASDGQARADDCFRAAGELARAQGALFWELRAALSAARLRLIQKDRTGAARLLRPVYDQFSEGFETSDLRAAKAVLSDLSSQE